MRSFAAMSLLGLCFASACAQDSPDPQDQVTEKPAIERVQAAIDWTAARRDLAARRSENANMLGVAGGTTPPVPVLLPDQVVSIASNSAERLQFRETADGYFAVVPGENYDLIINGSDRLIARRTDSPSISAEMMHFEETLTGAQLSFQRYNASYLAEFMCKAPDTARTGSCISESEARQVVSELLIMGSR